LWIECGALRVMADNEWIWRGMIGEWQDEWDLKRRGSDRSVNRLDTCRIAAYLNLRLKRQAGCPFREYPRRGFAQAGDAQPGRKAGRPVPVNLVDGRRS
jgi:hypothetical protein